MADKVKVKIFRVSGGGFGGGQYVTETCVVEVPADSIPDGAEIVAKDVELYAWRTD